MRGTQQPERDDPANRTWTRHAAALILTALLFTATAFAFNTGGPEVTWQNPVDGDNKSGTVIFNVSADLPGNMNVSNVTFRHNESQPPGQSTFNKTLAVIASTFPGQQFFNTTNDTNGLFSDGTVWVNATAINESDTANWTLVTFTVDNTQPVIHARLPLNNIEANGTFFVNATATDATTTVTDIWYNITQDGSLDAAGALNASVDSNNLPEGWNFVSYNATDDAGNVGYNLTAINITVDNAFPTITIENPANDTTTDSTPFLNASVDEHVIFWNYTVDGGAETSFNATNRTAANATLTLLGDGQHSVTVWVEDTGGNVNTSTRHFRVDAEPPAITPHVPESDSWVGGTIEVNVTGEDVGTNITSLNYTWVEFSNASNTTFGESLVSGGNLTNDTFNTNNLSNGAAYNITFWAVDFAGNRNTSANITNVSIDNTLPEAPFGLDSQNRTNDLNFSQTNRTAFTGGSPLVPRLLQGTTLGLEWNATNATDIPSGVEKFDIWFRNRTFNYTTQQLNTNWSKNGFGTNFGTVDGVTYGAGWQPLKSVSPNTNSTVNSSLFDNARYQFFIATVDRAGNALFGSRIDAALDITPPRLGTTSDGHIDTTPFNWTNQTQSTFSAVFADLAGMNITAQHINLSVVNGSHTFYPNVSFTPSDDGEASYTITTDRVFNLSNLSSYNISFNATDQLGNTNDAIFWNVSTDFNAPNETAITEFNTSANDDVTYPRGWLKDNHTVQVACSDGSVVGESGAYDVAAFTGGNLHRGWVVGSAGSGFERLGNVTVNESGTHTYEFGCRDRAGNVNRSVNATYKIDSKAPEVLDTTPDDRADGQNGSFTVFVNFTDESGESYVDPGASSIDFLDLAGQDPTVDSRTWRNDSVEMEVSELSGSKPYRIEGEIVDYVGHTTSFHIDFETKSNISTDDGNGGGGGGSSTTEEETQQTQQQQQQQLTESIDMVGLTGSETILVPGWVEDTFSVENDGDVLQTGIDMSWSSEGPVRAKFSESTFALASGDKRSIDVNISTRSDASPGTYTGTVTAESDEGQSVSASIDVTVKARGVTLVVERPDTVTVNRSRSTAANVTVSNEGTVDAGNVTFRVSAHNLTTAVAPGFAELPVDGVQEVEGTFDASGVPVGVYNASFMVNASAANTSSRFTVKVQPSSEAERQTVRDRLNAVEAELNASLQGLNASNTTDVDELRSKLRAAREAVQDGDYARAAQLSDAVRERMRSDGGLFDGLPDVPLVPLLAGILAVMLVGGAGVLVYHHFHGPQDLRKYLGEDAQGYTFQPETFPQRVERHVSLFIEHVGVFIEHLGERIHPPQQHLDEFMSTVSQAATAGGARLGNAHPANHSRGRSTEAREEPERMGVEVEDV